MSRVGRPIETLRRHTTSSSFTNSLVLPIPIPVPIYNLEGFPRLADLAALPGVHPGDAFWQNFCQHQESLAASVRNLDWSRYNAHVSVSSTLDRGKLRQSSVPHSGLPYLRVI